MKKNYTSPHAVIYNTLSDDYCADVTLSTVPDVVGTTVGGYGDTHAKVDGSGLLDD